jgi:hypothetical protein
MRRHRAGNEARRAVNCDKDKDVMAALDHACADIPSFLDIYAGATPLARAAATWRSRRDCRQSGNKPANGRNGESVLRQRGLIQGI